MKMGKYCFSIKWSWM